MNGPSASQVDAVVRAVLAERAAPARDGHDPTTFDFPGRVLSLRALEALPRSVQWVAIPCGAVVTPLARDFLKQRGIGLTLASPHGQSSAGEWALASDGESPRFEAYRRLALSGPEPWVTPGTDLESAAAWIAAHERRCGVILSECGARTVWRLHQRPALRAALVHDAESLARAAPWHPNVVVVEPAATPLPEWRHLVARFRRSFSPPVL
jgi:hypothetical protein